MITVIIYTKIGVCMLIYNEKYNFGIMWDISISNDDWIYGNINFIIDGEIYPKKFANNFTLNVIFSNLKQSFQDKYYPFGISKNELGNRNINYHKLNNGKESDIFEISTSELGDKFGKGCKANCLHLHMGYSDNTERLFYSDDFGDSFKEIRMLKGTVESIIMQLPCL